MEAPNKGINESHYYPIGFVLEQVSETQQSEFAEINACLLFSFTWVQTLCMLHLEFQIQMSSNFKVC